MTDDEKRAAALLLYRATLTTLRRCRGTGKAVRSNEDLALCSTPQLIDIVRDNDTLMFALALHYASIVAGDLPPLKPDPAPTKPDDWSVNLLAPEVEK